MTYFVGKRLLYSVLSLVALVIGVFFIARLTGDPTNLYVTINASEETRLAFAERNGFNDPLIEQFARFASNLLQFDLGMSLRQNRPAIEVVLEAFPTTLLLAAVSMSIAIVLAIIIGAFAAWRPDSAFDRVATILSLAASSLPNFWLAIVGVMILAVQLRWLPTSGTGGVLHWIMPVTVLVVRPLGVIVQVMRSSMLNALSSAYIKTARAKGVPGRTILFGHAVRNALLPVITVAGDQAAGIVNGAVIVETIFGFPGIGKIMIDAITFRDFSVIQAAVIITALAVFLMNILIDIAYALVDPRIRHS